MSNKIILTELAKLDLNELFNWYELKKVGLGKAFIFDFDKTIKKVEFNPFYASIIHNNARNATLSKFPYNIIYTVAQKLVYVHAVIHQSRNPAIISARLL